MRDAAALIRSRWTRAYWLAVALYGAGFVLGLIFLARSIPSIG